MILPSRWCGAAALLGVLLIPADARAEAKTPLPPGLRIETVVESAAFPVAMAFTPDGRLFYTENMPRRRARCASSSMGACGQSRSSQLT